MMQREEGALGECVRRNDDILSESRWNANVCAWHGHSHMEDSKASEPWEWQSSLAEAQSGKGFLWSKCEYLGMTHQ